MNPRVAVLGTGRMGSAIAPVIGAPLNVLKGVELVVAGGERADVDRVRPVLERLGELRHVGPFGSGARLKLVANSMLGALVLIAAELETAAKAIGLDPVVTFEVLARFVPSLAMRRAGYIEDRHEPTMFALRDLRKDLDLALSAFHGVDAHVPITALVGEFDAHHIARAVYANRGPAVVYSADFLPIGDESFRDQEPRGQFEVGTGGAHGHRQGPLGPTAVQPEGQADLQGLFGGNHVVMARRMFAIDPKDWSRDFRAKGHSESIVERKLANARTTLSQLGPTEAVWRLANAASMGTMARTTSSAPGLHRFADCAAKWTEPMRAERSLSSWVGSKG